LLQYYSSLTNLCELVCAFLLLGISLGSLQEPNGTPEVVFCDIELLMAKRPLQESAAVNLFQVLMQSNSSTVFVSNIALLSARSGSRTSLYGEITLVQLSSHHIHDIALLSKRSGSRTSLYGEVTFPQLSLHHIHCSAVSEV